MKQFLLDSDILMDFFKKRDYAVSLLDKLRKEGALATSILTITELRAGWNNEHAAYFLPRLYRFVIIQGIHSEIAELAGKFRWEYKLKGISLPTVDTLIAATAILEKCQLVTRNKKDFPMEELKFYQIEGSMT